MRKVCKLSQPDFASHLRTLFASLSAAFFLVSTSCHAADPKAVTARSTQKQAPQPAAARVANSPAHSSNSVLQFHPLLIGSSNYVYNSSGEELSHSIKTYQGKSGEFRLDTEVVDDVGLIGIRLFYKGKQILYKYLPRWQGLSEASYLLTDPKDNSSCNNAPVFRDINNDGFPELILTMDSGSAHGSVDVTIYQIKPTPGPVHEICHASLQSPSFADAEHNGVYSISVSDPTFAYWKDSAYCDFSSPGVVLSIKGATLVANAKLTAEAPPDAAAFEKLIKGVNKEMAPRDKFTQGKLRAVSPPVWNAMTSLVYGGNADKAKELLDRLYPAGTTLIVSVNNPDELKTPKGLAHISRDQFWKDFCAQLKKSPYAKVLYEMDIHKVLLP